ncbi:MAG TPA: ThuA domain-containing protein [Ktedonobacterales bacterium]|jgi:type 1 glutamine amidotransferase
MGKREHRVVLVILCATLVATILAGCAPAAGNGGSTPTAHSTCVAVPRQQASPATASCPPAILVFSKTAEFRHDSIPAAQAALRQLAAEHGWRADFTEDASLFTYEQLTRYDAVIFLLTTGDVLNTQQEAAFERYIRAGGGFVGVHSASDTEYGWAWYGGLVGAHNNQQNKHSGVVFATIQVVDHAHPSMAGLPDRWTRADEWYNFATNPRSQAHVLMTVDESTYTGGTMGADHPIAWYHEYNGGRAWYTALGHTAESYREPLFLAHLWGGVVYAADRG